MEYSFEILPPSGDRRDRAADIQKQLEKDGVCLLAAGTYFVTGVTMPHGSALFGMGEATRIILAPEITTGHAISMGSHCTLRDLTVLGDEADLPLPDVRPAEGEELPPVPEPWELGERHGIGFVGDATNLASCAHQKKDGILSGCRIRGFSGGGLHLHDTGYSTPCSLCVSDCRIHACGAGILISHFSEYHKFCGVVCTHNLYGCINNGGNNVFTGCAFDSNRQGFLIDNRENQSKNNAHGSCVGCTFNHTDHNTGIGIRILGSAPGYVFSGGQLYYSKVVIENSQGILFDAMNIGKNHEFHITGGGATLISSCFFSNQPRFFVKDNTALRIHASYTKGGDEVRFRE